MMKIKFSKKIIMLVAILFIGVFTCFVLLKSPIKSLASAAIPNNEDAKLIQEAIEYSYVLESEAATTFDTSNLIKVFVDDQRGAELSQEQLAFMQKVTNQPNTRYFGYLTYKTAYYNWWANGAIQMEELQSKAINENRPITKEDIQKIIEASAGLIPPSRSEGDEDKPLIRFHSLTISGDVATVTYDDGPRTNESTLVKIEGSWYIAGNTILSLHP
jgi:hypothetical protein